jgi:aryl sulfotransferase
MRDSAGRRHYGRDVPARPEFRYRSVDEDSARWWDFPHRPGDIVISTRSKSGTTWVQMICALLIFGTPELPDALGRLSPWLDWLVQPQDQVYRALAAQRHRRFIKTHTPLDGLPLDQRVTYVVVGRHPLDAAVSLYHQGDNLDRTRLRALSGQAGAPVPPAARPPLSEWLASWVSWDGDGRAELDSLPGVMGHLSDAWARRGAPNVVLVHYDDLSRDLDGQMRGLAARLGLAVDETAWPGLVEAASFARMREGAATRVPDTLGVLKDPARFFRHGVSGEGVAALSEHELARYHRRAADLAPPDMLAWLHHDRREGS